MRKLENISNKSLLNSKAKLTIDKKLDKIKRVDFVSNKIEEVNKVVQNLKLKF